MPGAPSRHPLTDEEIIAGLRKRPLDKYAKAAADRLEELLGLRRGEVAAEERSGKFESPNK